MKSKGGLLLVMGTVLALFLVVAACGGSSTTGAAAGDGEVTVAAREWGFQPGDIQLKVGQPVKITLRNNGLITHNVQFEGLDLLLEAGAGEAEGASVTPAKAGEFTFVCTLPGHKEAGMVGKLIIKA